MAIVQINRINPFLYKHKDFVVATITASSFSANSSQEILFCDASSGDITIYLPNIENQTGKNYTIKKIDNSAHTISVSGYSSQEIDGSAFIVIDTQYDSFSLVSDGHNWFIT